MGYVDNIIRSFGGTRPMAAAVGHPVSTVDSWRARGSIPDRHKPRVMEAGRARGLNLGPADFYPVAVPSDHPAPVSSVTDPAPGLAPGKGNEVSDDAA